MLSLLSVSILGTGIFSAYGYGNLTYAEEAVGNNTNTDSEKISDSQTNIISITDQAAGQKNDLQTSEKSDSEVPETVDEVDEPVQTKSSGGVSATSPTEKKLTASIKNGFYNEGNSWVYYSGGKAITVGEDIVQGTINGEHGWWYIKDGKVEFDYTGFAKNVNGWWYVENGKVTFAKNDVILGIVNKESGWWNVKGSKVLFNESVEPNINGWWYVKDGKVDFGYTGFAKNANGWWYIENGRVTFKKNDVIFGTVNGETGWWNVKNSQVIFNDTVEQNQNGWWYIDNGKVDFSFSGLGANSNGTWSIVNGKVDFSQNGWKKIEGKTYYLQDGKRATGVIKLGEEYYYLGESGVLASNYSGKYGNADLKTNNSGVIISIDYPVKTWINQLNYYGCYPMACGAAATLMALQANGYAEELSGEAGWNSLMNAFRAVRGSSYGKRYGNGVMTSAQMKQCVAKNSKLASVPTTAFTGSDVTLENIKDVLVHGQTVSSLVALKSSTHWIAVTGWYKSGDSTVFKVADPWPKDGKSATNYVTTVTKREDAFYSDRISSSELWSVLNASHLLSWHGTRQMLVIGNYK